MKVLSLSLSTQNRLESVAIFYETQKKSPQTYFGALRPTLLQIKIFRQTLASPLAYFKDLRQKRIKPQAILSQKSLKDSDNYRRLSENSR
jgi:hypothetical protein